MVIVIHQTLNTENAFLYNEKKVGQKSATFFHSRNTKSMNPFLYNKSHRLKELLQIEAKNPKVKNKCLHISVNPSLSDLEKLSDKENQKELDRFMQNMGYGNQPYFIYKHKDLERTHFHIVSTRIDRQTGMKIKDNQERRKVQNFIKELEQKYDLNNAQQQEEIGFKFSARSRNIKENLEALIFHLNQLESIESKEMYEEALKLFYVEIRKSGRGHIVVVTDDAGKVIRYPIRLSKFKEKPIFWISKKEELEEKFLKNVDAKIKSSHYRFLTDFFRELNKQVGNKDFKSERNKVIKIKRKNKGRKL